MVQDLMPKGHPVGELLPQFTFITGPNGSGKTTLGGQLFSNVNGLQLFSFAEPLREALVGLLYQGDINIDLTQSFMKDAPAPAVKLTHREVLNGLGDWVKAFFGPDYLGRLALHRVTADAEYFARFVFDDLRRNTDVEPILKDYGEENCLIIRLSRPDVGFEQPGHYKHDSLTGLCRTIELHNDMGIADLLPKLETELRATAP